MGPFPLLTDDLLDTSRQNFDFTQSLIDTLGDLGTPKDGFDAYLADTISIILAGSGVVGLLDGDLGTAGTIAGSIDPNSLDDVTAQLPGWIDTGTAIANDASALLAGVTGAPTPPTSGGGGGSSSGATQDFGTVTQGTSKAITINISNNGSVNITIKGIVVAGVNGPNIFSISNTYNGKVLGPGASVPLTINCYAVATSPGQYTSLLTINTNQPDPQPTMTLTATVVAPPPGAPPPSGGGGGGGGGDDGGGCDVGFNEKGKLVCLD